MNRRTTMIAAMLLGLAVTGIWSAGVFSSAPATSASTQTAVIGKQALFAIENMTCALCPVTVRKAMEGVAGVRSVEIDFDAKTAMVTFDPSVASVEAIAAASANAGYPAAIAG